jgi:hypothetical protein
MTNDNKQYKNGGYPPFKYRVDEIVVVSKIPTNKKREYPTTFKRNLNIRQISSSAEYSQKFIFPSNEESHIDIITEL